MCRLGRTFKTVRTLLLYIPREMTQPKDGMIYLQITDCCAEGLNAESRAG